MFRFFKDEISVPSTSNNKSVMVCSVLLKTKNISQQERMEKPKLVHSFVQENPEHLGFCCRAVEDLVEQP